MYVLKCGHPPKCSKMASKVRAVLTLVSTSEALESIGMCVKEKNQGRAAHPYCPQHISIVGNGQQRERRSSPLCLWQLTHPNASQVSTKVISALTLDAILEHFGGWPHFKTYIIVIVLTSSIFGKSFRL